MIPQEIIKEELENFSRLQRIKKDNNGQVNQTLDYEIKLSAAKLASNGVNVEDLIL